MTPQNSLLQLPICQWILPHQEKGWKVLASTRLPKLEQMDHTEPISPPLNQQSHLQPCRLSPIFQV